MSGNRFVTQDHALHPRRAQKHIAVALSRLKSNRGSVHLCPNSRQRIVTGSHPPPRPPPSTYPCLLLLTVLTTVGFRKTRHPRSNLDERTLELRLTKRHMYHTTRIRPQLQHVRATHQLLPQPRRPREHLPRLLHRELHIRHHRIWTLVAVRTRGAEQPTQNRPAKDVGHDDPHPTTRTRQAPIPYRSYGHLFRCRVGE